MKTYPLKIESDESLEGGAIFFSQGHHDSRLFLAAVREYGADGHLTEPRRERLRRKRPGGLLWLPSYLLMKRYDWFPCTISHGHETCKSKCEEMK